jgi:hypothetical protein
MTPEEERKLLLDRDAFAEMVAETRAQLCADEAHIREIDMRLRENHNAQYELVEKGASK